MQHIGRQYLLEESPPSADIDPTIREVARRLQDAGFEISSSGGHLSPEQDEDCIGWFPFVSLKASPSNLIAEAHRLHEVVRSWDVAQYEAACAVYPDTASEGVCGIDVGYNPASQEAELEVWGIDDSMLKLA
jgi:hypothetical protein